MVVAYFLPEIGSGAHIYYDLAKGFVRRGHEVHIITSYPREYNLHKKDKGNKYLLDEIIDGINVHRCKNILINRDIIFLRGLEHFTLPYIYFKRFKRLKINFDVCLIYIPPLPLYYFGEKIKKKFKIPYVLNFQDFHPDELTDVGVLKNKIVISILRHIEKKAYLNPDYITTISPRGIKLIKERSKRKNNLTCIYNSIDLNLVNKLKKIKNFKKKEKIEDKFLITYAGILSPFQGIDDILDVAKMLKNHKEIIFYIVGDGMAKEHLMERKKKEKIDNLKILPLQPRKEYFNIVNSSDINIVSLDRRMKAPCLPGKLQNLLALGKTIIANVPQENDIAKILKEVKCGLVITPGNPKEFKNAILKLKKDKKLREIFSKNGEKFVRENMNLKKNIKKYEEIFERIKL